MLDGVQFVKLKGLECLNPAPPQLLWQSSLSVLLDSLVVPPPLGHPDQGSLCSFFIPCQLRLFCSGVQPHSPSSALPFVFPSPRYFRATQTFPLSISLSPSSPLQHFHQPKSWAPSPEGNTTRDMESLLLRVMSALILMCSCLSLQQPKHSLPGTHLRKVSVGAPWKLPASIGRQDPVQLAGTPSMPNASP